MDFKKIINVALIPTLVLVVLGVINAVLNLVLSEGVLGIIGIVITLGIFAVSCLVLAYAGYSATKKNKLGLFSAALVGAVAGFVSSIINGIINLVLMFVNPATSSITAEGGSLYMVAGGLIAVVIGVIFWFVAAAVLGVIGGFIGQKM
ncbi:MAG: hypothetical protein Sv326_0078 [Candidatus Fermentimicrarchaeum limneticum]|uniref:DUF5518 domain-containing protein n=1 Tax=Fermentimicrarchaeum limneticum TaxID=2795018 RepID=A0A7D5XE67_FERL1|nr:MAG: hypothetical protein Sv326_0078 [Candidatus Fermentimicrarchaeum limneticum]